MPACSGRATDGIIKGPRLESIVGHKQAIALNASGIKVKHSVFLREGFSAEGERLLIGSEIGGDLDIEEAELDCYYAPSGLSAERATVTQAFIWKNIKRNKSTIVMLDMGNA